MTAKTPASPQELPSKDRLRLWLKILKTVRFIEAELRENLRTEFQSTLPRFDVMAALHRYPAGLKMGELSGVLKVSNGNVTGIVDRLVDEGHVVRESVPGDRRAARVRLTSRGRDEFIVQAAAHEAWINGLLQAVDSAQADEISLIFDQILAPHFGQNLNDH
ncbi:MarR family transcriptional regulator [Pacificimonas sp. WHA3]|uniref:MarR family transcriptional regulator n=1 Tax=Pacificimonas pallii TaxID=2827236 RepID=A0ABS6SAM5_9SPHN|nr:MarR family transcriptional regulator [Pacificimonas pallii]MBV7255336.1 MarR family transcriptional regulator [Pacificimonas pallii]